MEKVLEHQIERELLAGPPRPVRATVSTGLLLATAGLLFVIFVYGGGKALLESAKVAWLSATGHKANATITTLIYSDGRRGGSGLEPASHIAGVVYAFRDEIGALRIGSAATMVPQTPPAPSEYANSLGDRPSPPVADPPRPPVAPGQLLPVRYTKWGEQMMSGPAGSPPTGSVLFLAFAGFLVLGVSALLFIRMLRGTWQQVRLLRHGHATVGTIVHKTAQNEDSLRYCLRYGYADNAGKLHECEDICTMEQYRRFDIGQPVTVLYSSQDPTRAALYDLIPFKCPSGLS